MADEGVAVFAERSDEMLDRVLSLDIGSCIVNPRNSRKYTSGYNTLLEAVSSTPLTVKLTAVMFESFLKRTYDGRKREPTLFLVTASFILV